MLTELSHPNQSSLTTGYGLDDLRIQAWDHNGPNAALAAEAGEYFQSVTACLAQVEDLLRRMPAADPQSRPQHRTSSPSLARTAARNPAQGSGQSPSSRRQQPLAKTLFEHIRTAAAAVGQDGAGPQAALAGAVAENVAQWLQKSGAVKAVVKNSDSTALYLGHAQQAVLDIRIGDDAALPPYKLELSGELAEWWGVAAGSHSPTDFAVCVAAGRNAGAVGAAAAAALARCCTAAPTAAFAALQSLCAGRSGPQPGEVCRSLEQVQEFAQNLVNREIILGAYLFVDGRRSLTSGFAEHVAPLTAL